MDPSRNMFNGNSTSLQQMNTGNIFDSTQQKLSSSLNESSEAVWWEQKCERKATSCPNIQNANISDLSTSATHQRLGAPSLLRNSSFSNTSACLPFVDKSVTFNPSVLGVQHAHGLNNIKTNVEHQIDPYNMDDLVQNNFSFYNL